MIGCAEVVSVSALYGRHCNLTQFSFFSHCNLMYYASQTLHGSFTQLYIQHRYSPVSLCFTNSNSPYTFSSLCLSCNLSSSLKSLQAASSSSSLQMLELRLLTLSDQDGLRIELLVSQLLTSSNSFHLSTITSSSSLSRKQALIPKSLHSLWTSQSKGKPIICGMNSPLLCMK